MAPKVVRWVSKALLDLTDACNYVGQRDPRSADVLAKEIEAKVSELLENAYRGRKVPEHNRDHLRELVIRRYRILYRITTEEIVVLGVFSDRNQLPKSL